MFKPNTEDLHNKINVLVFKYVRDEKIKIGKDETVLRRV